MNRRVCVAMIAMGITLCFRYAIAEELSEPTAVLKRADAIRGSTRPWSFVLKAIDYNGQEVRSQSQYRVFVRGAREDVYRSLVLWTAPVADRGKVILMDGNVFWFYSPGTRNAVRISPAQRFAGLASSADIASTNFERDYEVNGMTQERVNNVETYKLSMTARNDQVAYHGIEYWVRRQDARPMICRYYALSGRLLKTAYFKDFREEMGESRPHELLIVDAVNANRTTRLLYSDLKAEEKPIHMYRKEYLPNVRE
jgi:hypothetical protein